MDNSKKIAFSVVGAGVGAVPFGVGAVYFTEQLLPRQMTGAKKFVAEHVVLPHHHFFDRLAKGLRTAHENYDKRKREALVAQGLAVPEEVKVPTTPEEHAYEIADVLVRAFVGLTGDFAATLGIQKVINKVHHIHSAHPFKNTAIDMGVTLGSIIAMPLFVPALSENIHNNLRKKIRDIVGISNDKADDLALPLTYVSVPNLLGMGAALGSERFMRRGR